MRSKHLLFFLIQNLTTRMRSKPPLSRSGGCPVALFLAVKEKFFYLQPKSQTQYTISVDITMRDNDISWSLTGVYEPQSATEKRDFLMELLSLK